MKVQLFAATTRLLLKPLTLNDSNFIFELVNTEGWIRFIGNRNIYSAEDANVYIQKIIDNKYIDYWVAQLKENSTSIGVLSFIKRDYLEHHDIGFAFLPAYFNKGYAYEAAHAALHKLVQQHQLSHILATTLPDNRSSITLLKKLHFQFEKEIEIEQKKLHVYGAAAQKLNDK